MCDSKDNYIPQRREFPSQAEWENFCHKMGLDPDDPDHHASPNVPEDDGEE
jgi:hypothetical protein